jgi:hypothetical protein
MENELLLDWTQCGHISSISVGTEITVASRFLQGLFWENMSGGCGGGKCDSIPECPESSDAAAMLSVDPGGRMPPSTSGRMPDATVRSCRIESLPAGLISAIHPVRFGGTFNETSS